MYLKAERKYKKSESFYIISYTTLPIYRALKNGKIPWRYQTIDNWITSIGNIWLEESSGSGIGSLNILFVLILCAREIPRKRSGASFRLAIYDYKRLQNVQNRTY